MAGITLDKGTLIYDCEQPMTALHLITEGRVTVAFPGGTYHLGKGDIIGICEIGSEVHFLRYTAAENVTILTYPCSNMNTLDTLLKKHPDVARLFLLSAFHQLNTLLDRCSVSELDCNSLYQNLVEGYKKYDLLCKRYRIASRPLGQPEELTAYLTEEDPDLWLTGYYLGLAHLLAGENYKLFVEDPALASGFLRKCGLDYRKTYASLEEQFRYLQQVTTCYFNDSGEDLFDFYTSLYYKLGPDCPDTEELYHDINRMIHQLENNPCIDSDLFAKRVDSFRNSLNLLQTSSAAEQDKADDTAALGNLVGSLNTILEFADPKPELASSFRQHIQSYKLLEDKLSTDEDVCRLRSQLTKEFYELYGLLFCRTLEASSVPAPVMMFLYFGYVDEELAGVSNAVYLHNLADNMTDHSSQGVYTFYDWLTAIYEGRREPSRNEFEQDYSDYIHKQKIGGSITDAEMAALEKDNMAKVRYELDNMFPIVNKITYGRITTFCPVFSADDVLKSLSDSLVTVSAVAKALEQIKKVDYTLFYRESMDMENMNALGKEMLHFEYLPDIILMPNVGTRGVMWQEIEGKRRNSSGRMLLSVFHMEDLNLTATRLAAEFRWELCKRIQGAHWNDISDPSLTSEYFDYIQFYRKSHDLTSEAKEKVRTSLQRAKNSFKEMFIRDYIVWIMFEGSGSPRLNKVARRILFTYCPFPSDICESLKQNPLYTELMTRYELKKAQRLHHLDGLIRKLRNGGTPVPGSLERERLYAEGKISS